MHPDHLNSTSIYSIDGRKYKYSRSRQTKNGSLEYIFQALRPKKEQQAALTFEKRLNADQLRLHVNIIRE